MLMSGLMRVRFGARVVLLGAILVLAGAPPAYASGASYAQAVLADHPTAFYQFSDAVGSTSFADSSGNGNSATSDGSDQIVVPGPFGAGTQALSIGDDGAQAPQLAPMQADNDRTVELWFETTQTGDECLLSAGTQSATSSFSLCLTNGQQGGAPPPNTPGVYLQTWNADVYIPNLELTDGSWHYIATTLSGSTVTIDVDGQTPAGFVWNGSGYSGLTSQPFTLPFQPDTTATAVGIGSAGWASVFSGEIAEAAIYPTALGTSRLDAHYQAATSSSPPPVSISPPTISGNAVQGQTLIEAHGSWSGSPPAFAYQWARCDSAGNGCVSISGATGQSYTVTAQDVGHTIRVVEDASNAGGVGTPATSAPTLVVPATSPGIEQVVFVHGLNASCAVAGATDYKALYDALVGQGMGVYTFCYDHDIAFGDPHSGLQNSPSRCFSNSSRGETVPEAATATRERATSRNHIGPLYVSQNKPGAGESDDGDDPLAYDAAKLDDCLRVLVNYDVRTYGQPLPIAVIGNSMGGAITRGWMQLAKSRNSASLEGVTTVAFIEGATQGSWIAAVGEGVDLGLSVGGTVGVALDTIARHVAASSFHANPGRAGIQDLAPQSAWYRSIVAAGPSPRLHFFSLSVDITLDFKQQVLWWTNDLGSTDFIGDGVIQLGSRAYNALPAGGGSQFLPFGSAADQNQYVIRPPTYNEMLTLEPSPQPPFVSVSVDFSNPYSNPYNHFNFGTYMGKENAQEEFSGGLFVSSCDPHLGSIAIPDELTRVLEDPAEACGPSASRDLLRAPDRTTGAVSAPGSDAASPLATASSTGRSLTRTGGQPVVFRDRLNRSALALYTSAGNLQGTLTLLIAHRGTFVATLPRRLLGRRVIDLNTVISATTVGSTAVRTIRIRLRGKLQPTNHQAQLTILGNRPRLRVVLVSAIASAKAAKAAGNRVISLVADGNLAGLARMLSPSLLAGRSPTTVADELRSAHVHVKSIGSRGPGRMIWLPDGNPGWLLPVTARATGRPPLRVALVLEEQANAWRLVGSTG